MTRIHESGNGLAPLLRKNRQEPARADRWDNRPSWDNIKPGWDNRPSWDNR
ncbi:multiple cyclophane-containing RiPP AmcA [Actinoalloteichus fjordicus]